MPRTLIMLLTRKNESAAEIRKKPPAVQLPPLAHFWLAEGRRAFRESVIGDKIGRETRKWLDSGMWF